MYIFNEAQQEGLEEVAPRHDSMTDEGSSKSKGQTTSAKVIY